MQNRSVEIVPAEGGWAVKTGGVHTHVFATYALAVAAVNRAEGHEPAPVIWVHGTDGVAKPQQGEAGTEPFGAGAAKTKPAEPATEVTVAEHIAVPANIHGQDMRDLQNSRED